MSEPTIYKPGIYNGNCVYNNGAGGGGGDNYPKSTIKTETANNGIDFNNKKIIVSDGVWETETFEAVSTNFELEIEFKITNATSYIDKGIFCPQNHYKSFDFQLTDYGQSFFMGISQDGNSWYNWDTINNKRKVTLSDYGITILPNNFYDFKFKYDSDSKRVVAHIDNIKIIDVTLSITPVFDITRYKFFANFDSFEDSKSTGEFKFDNLLLKINGDRKI